MTIRAYAVIALTLTGLGCAKTVSDFVSRAVPPPDQTTRAPAALSQPAPVAAGAGSVDATAGPLRMKAAVNADGALRQLGPDRSARLTFGRPPTRP